MEERISKENASIDKKMREAGYANKIIDYTEFLKIYSLYGQNIMSELEFAYLLGMNHGKFRTMRNRGTKTRILVQVASEELKNEIKNSLTQRGYVNKKITYEEFLELYSEYSKHIIEQEFAEIIGLTPGMYKSMKNKGTRTTVLRQKIDVDKVKAEIERNFGSNILIDYNTFLEMYKPYENKIHSEVKFAEIIGIGQANYYGMKTYGTKARILKPNNISETVKKQIIQDIVAKGYSGKLIDYSAFLSLYQNYSNLMSEKEFAKILGITEIKFKNLKYQNNKTYIALDDKTEITNRRVEEIRHELISKGYANKNIKYAEFLKIYASYKSELGEIEFAKILGISYSNFSTIKNQGSGAIILKTEKISEELIKKIFEDETISKFSGKLISYEQFKNLYEPYSKFMSAQQFAETIGISYTQYGNLIRTNHRVRVQKRPILKQRIKYLFQENRLYSKKEIMNFCIEFDCDIREFFEILFNPKYKEITDEYINILNKKRKIFVGKTPVDKKYLNRYGSDIIADIINTSKMLELVYKDSRWSNDIVSDTIVYIFSKRGDVFINYDEENALKLIKGIARGYMKRVYTAFNSNQREYSIDKMLEKWGDIRFINEDTTQRTEIDAIDNLEGIDDAVVDNFLDLLDYYHETELSGEETLEKLSHDLNLDSEIAFEIMKQSLLRLNETRHSGPNKTKKLTKIGERK